MTNPFPRGTIDYDYYEKYGEDYCPICGEIVTINGKTKDGRLIGTCGDAFTIKQWEEDDAF